MLKILIVYENIPDSTYIYSVEVSDEDWEWMKLTHRCYINFDMSDECQTACERLSEFLEGRKNLFSSNDENPKPISASKYDYIIHTGFGM